MQNQIILHGCMLMTNVCSIFISSIFFSFLFPDAFWLRSGKAIVALSSISVRNMDWFLWVYQDNKIWKVAISSTQLYGIPRDRAMPKTPDDIYEDGNGTKRYVLMQFHSQWISSRYYSPFPHEKKLSPSPSPSPSEPCPNYRRVGYMDSFSLL